MATAPGGLGASGFAPGAWVSAASAVGLAVQAGAWAAAAAAGRSGTLRDNSVAMGSGPTVSALVRKVIDELSATELKDALPDSPFNSDRPTFLLPANRSLLH